MKHGKRILSMLLALVMVVGMAPMPAMAEETTEAECVCVDVACTEEQFNKDCPVCGIPEADLTKCAQYVAPAAQSGDTQGTTSEPPAPENKGTQDPVSENQSTDNQVVENQGTDNPSTDTPSNDIPDTDNPGTDSPSTDNPGTDNPGTDSPSTDNPSTDNPGTDNPGTDSPSTDNPSTDNPGTDNPDTDSPSTDNPGTDNPGTENQDQGTEGDDDQNGDTPVCVCGGLTKCAEGAMNECAFCATDMSLCEGTEPQTEAPVCTCEGLPACAEGAMNDCAFCAEGLGQCLGTPVEEGPQVLTITDWRWNDPEEFVTDNVMALGGVNEENRLDWDTLLSMLPTIFATIDGQEQEITLTWTSADFVANENGLYPIEGTYTLTAALPEGYVLGEGVAPLTLGLELGGIETYGNAGDLNVEGDAYTYDDVSRTLTITGDVTISGETAQDKIVVSGNANVTLNGLDIQVSIGNAFALADGASCTLTLADETENALKTTGHMKAGINVPEGTTLTIEGGGSLSASSGQWAAGIGNNKMEPGNTTGTINIAGGTIYASGWSAPAIGNSNSNGGTINISGGVVVAEASGAWVPGCMGGTNAVNITGGTVTARGTGDDAKGIYGSNITISGGTVTATGHNNATGIAGTFTTTDSGKAIIKASSIEDKTDKDNWKGIIFDGNSGIVGGTQTLPENLTIEGNQTLTIPEGSTLTIPEGVELKNNGTLEIQGEVINNGTITNNGTINAKEGALTNNGTITNNGLIWGNVSGNGEVKGYPANSFYGLTVTDGKEGEDYTFDTAAKTLTIQTGKALTISGSTTDAKVVVAGGVNASVTLENARIEIAEDENHAFELAGKASCQLTLKGVNSLKGGPNSVGLAVPSEAALTITGDSTGSLTARGSNYAAGVGGGYRNAAGSITIDGGTVTAVGGRNGAGIGGGGRGAGGNITINGGTVTASSEYGAGIGGGDQNADGTVTITGGTVTASSEHGAGIGGGSAASSGGGSVTITGGTVTASGGDGSAGIGTGRWDNRPVTFSTGENGDAVIFTNSISDQSGKVADSWGGVIFEGDNGKVYGDPVLNTNAVIPEGKTLVIEEGQTLTIPGTVTLTNNGKIVNKGTIIGKVNGNQPFVPVAYVNAQGQPQTAVEALALDGSTETIGTGWYFATGTVTGENLTVTGDVNLILTDGSSLQLSDAFTVSGGSLTIWQQSGGTGKLTCAGIQAKPGTSGGNIVINGGTLQNGGGTPIALGSIQTINGGTFPNGLQVGQDGNGAKTLNTALGRGYGYFDAAGGRITENLDGTSLAGPVSVKELDLYIQRDLPEENVLDGWQDELTCEAISRSGKEIRYQWYRDGSPIDGAEARTYTPTELGSYHCVASTEDSTAISTVCKAVEMPDCEAVFLDWRGENPRYCSFMEALEKAQREYNGTIKLMKEVRVNDLVQFLGIFTLDLNGQTFLASRVRIPSTASVTITDSVGTGKVENGKFILESVYGYYSPLRLAGGIFENGIMLDSDSDDITLTKALDWDCCYRNDYGVKINDPRLEVTRYYGYIRVTKEKLDASVLKTADGRLVNDGDVFYGEQTFTVTQPQDLLLRVYLDQYTALEGGSVDVLADGQAHTIEAVDVDGGRTTWTVTVKPIHEVRFDTRGGSAVETQYVKDGDLATIPSPAPEREGFPFGGWYKDQACTETWDFSTPVTADTTIYAKWIGYTITFDSAGGTPVETMELPCGGQVTAPQPPTKAGYTFTGWSPALPETLEESITVTAQWELKAPEITPFESYEETYDGVEHELTFTAEHELGGITYEIRRENGTSVSSGASFTVKNVADSGIYKVKATVTDGTQTKSTEQEIEVSITPAPLTVTDAGTIAVTKTYDGTLGAGELSGEPTVDGILGSDQVTVTTTRGDYEDANAGTRKTVVLSFTLGGTDAGNYSMANYTFTGAVIEPKEVTLIWPAAEDLDLTYNGQPRLAKAEARGLVGGDKVSVTVEKATGSNVNVGDTFTCTAVSLDNTNYKLPTDEADLTSGEYAIQAHALTKADFQVDLGNKTYTGEAIEPVVTSAKTYVTANDFDVVYEDNRVVGTATITITGKGNCTGEVSYTFQIIKADPEVEWPTDLSGDTGAELGTVVLPEGFTWDAPKTAIAYGVNEYPMTFTPDDTDNYNILHKDVEVKGNDVAAPTAEITVSTHKWNTFLNNITFDLFFKATQTVTITASDTQSGLASIQYFVTDTAQTLEQVKARTSWTTYSRPFNVNPDGKFIVYAKATDNAGNALYLSSDGLILDATAPAISGIENGKTYLEQVTFTVTDANLNTVTVDGVPVTLMDGKYTITADNKDHIVAATDKAGNSVAYRITVLEVYTVTYKADGKVVDTQRVPYGQNTDAPEVPKKSGYSGKWDHDGKNITEDTTITAKYTKSWWDNPKTGDAIRGVLVVLVVSATALVGIGGYAFWQKKRKK